MRKLRGIALGALMLASGSTWAAGSTAPGSKGEQGSHDAQGQGSQGRMGQSNGQGTPVIGVIANVDKKASTLTLVTPVTDTSVTEVGSTIVIDRDRNLFAIRAPLANDAKIQRDGSSAKIGELKEGDLVRASLDPTNGRISQLKVISQNKVSQGFQQGKKDMSPDLDTGDSAPGGQQH